MFWIPDLHFKKTPWSWTDLSLAHKSISSKNKKILLVCRLLDEYSRGALGDLQKKISVEDRVCNEKESRSTSGENEQTSLCKSAFACMTLANVLPLAAGHKGFQSDCNCDG